MFSLYSIPCIPAYFPSLYQAAQKLMGGLGTDQINGFLKLRTYQKETDVNKNPKDPKDPKDKDPKRRRVANLNL